MKIHIEIDITVKNAGVIKDMRPVEVVALVHDQVERGLGKALDLPWILSVEIV
jgi:hypothetical protein